MERGRFGRRKLLAAVVFITAIIVLSIKLLNPASVQIFVEGNTAITGQIPGLYTYTDVLVLVISSLLVSGSGTYLLLYDALAARPDTRAPSPPAPVGSMILEERRQQWEETAKTLKKDEHALYKAIIDEGIINQSELGGKTGLSRSDISRALYLLEAKGLIERKRLGMGNVVLLK
ncbi:MAG: helix-turn-helix transcriptional regulator [Halobacteriota archaeon]